MLTRGEDPQTRRIGLLELRLERLDERLRETELELARERGRRGGAPAPHVVLLTCLALSSVIAILVVLAAAV